MAMNNAVKTFAAGEELDVLLARSCTQRFGAAVASLRHIFGNVAVAFPFSVIQVLVCSLRFVPPSVVCPEDAEPNSVSKLSYGGDKCVPAFRREDDGSDDGQLRGLGAGRTLGRSNSVRRQPRRQ